MLKLGQLNIATEYADSRILFLVAIEVAERLRNPTVMK